MAKRYIADTFEGVATTVVDDAITNAKLSNMAVNTIKGRITAGTGDPEDLTATQVRTIINVADGANNYVHPASHPPSIITQDASNRFVTDTEKNTWNDKIGGTGTINYIPKFTSTGTLENSAIFESGGNVLIGTTTANGAKLQVNGSCFFSGALATDGVISTKNEYSILRKDTYAQAGALFSAAGNITFDMFNVGAVLNFTAGTGSATFASSVTATNFIKSGGTSAQYLMADGSVTTGTALPYKVYTALMQQSGTAAPTATIMQNTLGATITWSRFGTGQYIGTASSGVLTIGKTTVIVTRPNPSATAFDTNVAGNPINTTTFAYSTFNNTAYLDDQSFSVFVEIRVYP